MAFVKGKLPNNAQNGDFTHFAVLTYEDLQTIGNGGQATIGEIPAGGGIDLMGVYESTAVAGTTTLVIDIGTTAGDPDEFIDALDVDAMTAPVYNTGDSFVQAAGTTTIAGGSLPVGLTASDADILLEVTDANIASATAGEIVVAWRVVDLARFANVNG
jgi:hypothetical protein